MVPTRTRLATIVATVVGATVTVVLVAALGFGSSDGSETPQVARPATTSTAEPTEPTATEPGSEAVLPDVPVRDSSLDAQPAVTVTEPIGLELTTIGIDVPVDPVGVQPDGQMEIPEHAERAGWYRFGPAPGSSEGTSVIAAHVDSIVSAGLGPFARLRDLDRGDEVSVDLADGSTVRYAVQDVAAIPKSEVLWPEVFTEDGPARLVLITCGGAWQPNVRQYSDNVIVYLEPVAS